MSVFNFYEKKKKKKRIKMSSAAVMINMMDNEDLEERVGLPRRVWIIFTFNIHIGSHSAIMSLQGVCTHERPRSACTPAKSDQDLVVLLQNN